MKNLLLTLFLVVGALRGIAQNAEPWIPEQLLAPADLAAQLKQPAEKQPLVICVGPSAVIPGSVDAGPGKEANNLEKLRAILDKQDRGREVVIYCGCCPFARCPNVRPAFTLLNGMHFAHARLLDIPHNIKTDWIDAGFPVKGGK